MLVTTGSDQLSNGWKFVLHTASGFTLHPARHNQVFEPLHTPSSMLVCTHISCFLCRSQITVEVREGENLLKVAERCGVMKPTEVT